MQTINCHNFFVSFIFVDGRRPRGLSVSYEYCAFFSLFLENLSLVGVCASAVGSVGVWDVIVLYSPIGVFSAIDAM